MKCAKYYAMYYVLCYVLCYVLFGCCEVEIYNWYLDICFTVYVKYKM
jgi:hypothetical protein